MLSNLKFCRIKDLPPTKKTLQHINTIDIHHVQYAVFGIYFITRKKHRSKESNCEENRHHKVSFGESINKIRVLSHAENTMIVGCNIQYNIKDTIFCVSSGCRDNNDESWVWYTVQHQGYNILCIVRVLLFYFFQVLFCFDFSFYSIQFVLHIGLKKREKKFNLYMNIEFN